MKRKAKVIPMLVAGLVLTALAVTESPKEDEEMSTAPEVRREVVSRWNENEFRTLEMFGLEEKDNEDKVPVRLVCRREGVRAP